MNTGLEKICNANCLADAFKEAKKETSWKEAVQRYEINLLQNLCDTQQRIRSGNYVQKALVEFNIHERGHVRCIKAQHISDRVVQRSLTDNVLLPAIRKKLIYDNGASLKGKGLSFSKKRFFVHLNKAYKRWGAECFMMSIDFSKFFDNLRHALALEMTKPLLTAAELDFVSERLKSFEIDVSYMNDKEYAGCMERVFNSLEYVAPPKQNAGKKWMAKSMPIGNHISQVFGVFYPTPLDTYFKVVCGFEFYGRYMDDIYIIHNDKEKILRSYEGAKEVCKRLGLFINDKKTRLRPLRAGVQFLKINAHFNRRGRLIKTPHSSLWQRERRRLVKFKKLLRDRKITMLEIWNCYYSWRCNHEGRGSKNKIHRMDNCFGELFKEELRNEYRRNERATAKQDLRLAMRPV